LHVYANSALKLPPENERTNLVTQKTLRLEKADVKKTIIQKKPDEYEITQESSTLVKNVGLSIRQADGFFSRNYYDL